MLTNLSSTAAFAVVVVLAAVFLGLPDLHLEAKRAGEKNIQKATTGTSSDQEELAVMGAKGSKDSGWAELNHAKPAEASNMAVFGAGCYWGTEAFMVKKFKGALTKTAVGFMGPKGAKEDPSYSEVCSGSTGHVEVLAVTFDPEQVTYEDLVRHFFTFHDPTTRNRQGNDVGPQYASVIFVSDDAQREVANKVIAELNERLEAGTVQFTGRGAFQNKEVTTHVTAAATFYAAHEEHQRYLEANPNGYCNHGIRFKW